MKHKTETQNISLVYLLLRFLEGVVVAQCVISLSDTSQRAGGCYVVVLAKMEQS